MASKILKSTTYCPSITIKTNMYKHFEYMNELNISIFWLCIITFCFNRKSFLFDPIHIFKNCFWLKSHLWICAWVEACAWKCRYLQKWEGSNVSQVESLLAVNFQTQVLETTHVLWKSEEQQILLITEPFSALCLIYYKEKSLGINGVKIPIFEKLFFFYLQVLFLCWINPIKVSFFRTTWKKEEWDLEQNILWITTWEACLKLTIKEISKGWKLNAKRPVQQPWTVKGKKLESWSGDVDK